MNRIAIVKSKLQEKKIDALLITNPENLYYLCGYSGSNGMLLIKKEAPAIFYTDFRYKEQIKKEVKGCQKKIWDRSLFSAFPVADLKGLKTLAVEANHISYANFCLIKNQLKLNTRILPITGVIENLREIKDAVEIIKIKRAVNYTDKVFLEAIKMAKPGITEKDLANEIDYQFLQFGGIAFPSIVAFAERGALPHAQPTNKKLKKGDVIVVDIGAKFEHYCADMTRTAIFGKASGKVKNIYEIVLTAQKMALAKIRTGKTAQEIDAVARNYIQEKGYGKYFGHGLGHGIGLAVHELPTVNSKSKDVIQANQVFSVEPGIYLPNEFGVRIEDLVVAKKNGCEILTKSPKELTEL